MGRIAKRLGDLDRDGEGLRALVVGQDGVPGRSLAGGRHRREFAPTDHAAGGRRPSARPVQDDAKPGIRAARDETMSCSSLTRNGESARMCMRTPPGIAVVVSVTPRCMIGQ